MKNGKLRFKRGLGFLLGAVVAGALLFAACPSVFDSYASGGYGRVSVEFGQPDARTIMPDAPGYNDFDDYEYKFLRNGAEVDAKAETISGADYYVLPVGTYELTVSAFQVVKDGDGKVISRTKLAEGKSAPFKVEKDEVKTVNIVLGPAAVQELPGTFKFSIDYPVAVDEFVWSLETPAGDSIKKDSTGADLTITESDSAVKTRSGNWKLTAGSYLFSIRIYQNSTGSYWGVTEAVQIYSGMTTTYEPKAVTDLAKIATEEEAVLVLKQGIKSWWASNPAQSDYVSALVSQNITMAHPGEVTLYFVGSRLGSLSQFPINFKGGWTKSGGIGIDTLIDTVATLTFNNGDDLNFTYNIKLVPVALYKVSVHPDAAAANTTAGNVPVNVNFFFTHKPGEDAPPPGGFLINQSFAARDYIGLIDNKSWLNVSGVTAGATPVNNPSAAITIVDEGETLIGALPNGRAPNVDKNVFSDTGRYVFSANPSTPGQVESKVYEIQIHRTYERQKADAIAYVKANARVWVDESVLIRNKRVNNPEFWGGAGATNPEPEGLGLYYIHSKLSSADPMVNAEFPIDFSKAQVWPWTWDNFTSSVTPTLTTASKKNIACRLSSGDYVSYQFWLIPNAEIVFDFVDGIVPPSTVTGRTVQFEDKGDRRFVAAYVPL